MGINESEFHELISRVKDNLVRSAKLADPGSNHRSSHTNAHRTAAAEWATILSGLHNLGAYVKED